MAQQVRRTPDHPVLRPGLRVFRRDDTHLQVGIDDPRVVLRDTDGIRRLLRELERGDGLGSLTPEAGLALDRLLAADLLVDRDELRAATADRSGTGPATFAAHGPRARALLAARASCHVSVRAPEPWRAVAAERLATAGIPLAAVSAGPTVTLVIAGGEPARSASDALVREDQPHLWVILLPDRARLGPFVVPGSTACLRCVDAHLGEHDARRGVVLEQLEPVAPPMPSDAVLAHAAVALAARELMTYAEGERPATWSATLTLNADLGQPLQAWPRHPHCGCSWG